MSVNRLNGVKFTKTGDVGTRKRRLRRLLDLKLTRRCITTVAAFAVALSTALPVYASEPTDANSFEDVFGFSGADASTQPSADEGLSLTSDSLIAPLSSTSVVNPTSQSLYIKPAFTNNNIIDIYSTGKVASTIYSDINIDEKQNVYLQDFRGAVLPHNLIVYDIAFPMQFSVSTNTSFSGGQSISTSLSTTNMPLITSVTLFNKLYYTTAGSASGDTTTLHFFYIGMYSDSPYISVNTPSASAQSSNSSTNNVWVPGTSKSVTFSNTSNDSYEFNFYNTFSLRSLPIYNSNLSDTLVMHYLIACGDSPDFYTASSPSDFVYAYTVNGIPPLLHFRTKNFRFLNSYIPYFSITTPSSDTVSGAVDNVNDTIKQEFQKEIDKGNSSGADAESMVSQLQNHVMSKWEILFYPITFLKNFIKLFTDDDSSPPTLTFPSFSLTIGGTPHTIWNSYTFDFSSLNTQFSSLFTVIRSFSSVIMVGAFIKYLEHMYNKIFKGG